jgi:hypothetical protein
MSQVWPLVLLGLALIGTGAGLCWMARPPKIRIEP